MSRAKFLAWTIVAAGVVALLALGPFVVLLSLDVLFGLDEPYSFSSWVAVVALGCAARLVCRGFD